MKTKDKGIRNYTGSHFRLEGEIARGRLGRVMRAYDTRLKRYVALKLLLHDEHQERFLREARITARLQHPNIIPLHEVGRWPSGELFYAMKLVAGCSLHKLIDKEDLSARLKRLHDIIAICEAIAYAHSQRILHCALEPRNILFGEYGEAVIIGWGSATESGAQERGPRASAYMPPEQATEGTLNECTDVYSLGAILYHVLTGRPPRERAFSHLDPTLPRALVAVAERAMQRDPSRRYQSAKQLSIALKRAQSTGALQRSLTERWLERYKRPLLLSALLLLALLLARR